MDQQPESSSPNGRVWRIDQCQLDVKVTCRDSFGEEATSRPWLVIVVDEHSRAIVGSHLSLEPPTTGLPEFIQSLV